MTVPTVQHETSFECEEEERNGRDGQVVEERTSCPEDRSEVAGRQVLRWNTGKPVQNTHSFGF